MSTASSFQNLSVRTKIIAAFTSVLLALAGMGVFSVLRLNEVNAHAAELRDNWLPATRYLAQLAYYTTRYRQRQAVYLLYPTDAERIGELKTLATLKMQAADAQASYEPLVTPGPARALADSFEHKWADYLAMEASIFHTFRTNGQAAAVVIYNGTAKKVFNDFYESLDSAEKFQVAGGTSAGNEGQAAYASARIWIFGTLGFAALLCLGAGISLIKAISAPLGLMSRAMNELAAGRLDTIIPAVGRTDEIGTMAEAVEVFKRNAIENKRLSSEAERKIAEQTALIGNSIGAGLEALSKGDFSTRVNADLVGPLAKLKTDFNVASSRLQDMSDREREKALAEAKKTGETSKMLMSIASGFSALSGGQLDIRLNETFLDEFEQLRADFNMTVILLEKRTMAERQAADETAKIVARIAGGLKELSGGNLQVRIDEAFHGDYEQLRTDFNAALTRLQDTVQTVLVSTGGINTSADEISAASDDLSKRTEQQAASLEETAAALEEITATVKKTAQNARDATKIVSVAKSAAENGGGIVGNAIEAMEQIEQSSKKITDIIGVIDEIAFQTNLLALNAGVEAARAGDAGRGFAVVASEVRILAQRSSEASREIKALIKSSSERVAAGVTLVGESGAALKEIVSQVQEVNSLVTEMAQAAQQQATGIDEVNTAVAQMDQVTQQNAAMVEQTTAAASNLSTETAELARLISFFKVGEQNNSAAQSTRSGFEKTASRPKLKRVASGR